LARPGVFVVGFILSPYTAKIIAVVGIKDDPVVAIVVGFEAKLVVAKVDAKVLGF
jgi:hypothetical protein